jgi:hypothetical protein
MISNQVQIISNFDRSKMDLPELEKLKYNTVEKVLKKGTTSSIGTPPDSKWISNKNLEKFLGLG